MKIVMLAKYMSYSNENPWLTDELAYELCRQGAEVHVILLDRSGDWPAGTHHLAPGLKVTAYPLDTSTSRGGLCSKWSLFVQWRRIIGEIKSRESVSYDLVINFSIAALFYGVAKHFRADKIAAKSLLVLWDFFPIHQLEIGRLRSRVLARLLYSIEHAEIATYDFVGLMSEKNIDFFHQYHKNVRAQTLRLPIWGALPSEIISQATSPVIDELVDSACFNVIFGGQLVRGRGVEQIIELAIRIRSTLPDVRFLIMGDGELRSDIMRHIERDGVSNVRLCQRVDRATYRSVVAACDAGLVITVSGVSIPSFPSKVIDYMLARKPVIACTEESSDFGDYIEHRYRCGFSVNTGDLAGLEYSIRKLQADPWARKSMGENAFKAFVEHHDVVNVANIIKKLVGHG